MREFAAADQPKGQGRGRRAQHSTVSGRKNPSGPSGRQQFGDADRQRPVGVLERPSQTLRVGPGWAGFGAAFAELSKAQHQHPDDQEKDDQDSHHHHCSGCGYRQHAAQPRSPFRGPTP